MVLEIVDRKIWGARKGRDQVNSLIPMKHPAVLVFSCCTRSFPCENKDDCMKAVKNVQNLQMDVVNLTDIGFNFVVDGLGTIYRGRGWHLAPLLPWHFASMNVHSFYLGFIGQYTEDDLPEIMVKAREDIINFGIEKKLISENCTRNPMFPRHMFFMTAIKEISETQEEKKQT